MEEEDAYYVPTALNAFLSFILTSSYLLQIRKLKIRDQFSVKFYLK